MIDAKTSLLDILPSDRYMSVPDLAVLHPSRNADQVRAGLALLHREGLLEKIREPQRHDNGTNTRYKYRLMIQTLALDLCAKYPGVWGQLYWSSREK